MDETNCMVQLEESMKSSANDLSSFTRFRIGSDTERACRELR